MISYVYVLFFLHLCLPWFSPGSNHSFPFFTGIFQGFLTPFGAGQEDEANRAREAEEEKRKQIEVHGAGWWFLWWFLSGDFFHGIHQIFLGDILDLLDLYIWIIGIIMIFNGTGLWFGTWMVYFSHHIGNSNLNWRTHIFQRGWSTTNQGNFSWDLNGRYIEDLIDLIDIYIYI